MQKVNSPDIQTLDFGVLLDISTNTPTITLTNLSTASNPTSLDWVFEIYSPLGTAIHQGDFSAPDVDGVWSAPFVRNSGFPRPFNQIEWSGKPYRVIARVRDGQGKTYQYEKSVKVCRPSGNTSSDKHTFGKGFPKLQARCQQAKLLVEDVTNFSYAGYNGVMVSKLFRLTYPMDETGNRPAPVDLIDFHTGLLPLRQSGAGYEYFYTSVYDYAQGNNVTVRVKYTARDTYKAHCNIDLSPIACQLQKMVADLESGNCRDAARTQRMIDVVNAKLHIATIGILYPQAGIDPNKLVGEINELTGWNCNCCPSGINEAGVVDEGSGVVYDVIEEGGDVNGYVTVVGSTVQIRLKDFTYVSRVQGGSAALGITQSVVGNTKYFNNTLNTNVLADEILAVYEGNTSFRNRLITMIGSTLSAGNMNVNINKRCLPLAGAAGSSSNYTFSTRAFAAGESILLRFFRVGATPKYIQAMFDGSDVDALVTTLNTQGIGLFGATFSAGRVLTITSTNNSNDITELVGHFSGDPANQDYSFIMSRQNLGTTVYPVQDVLQSIVDWVCGSIVNNITLGVGLSILQLQAVGGAIDTIAIKKEDSLQYFFGKFTDAYNKLVQIVQALKQPDCTTIQSIFNQADTDGLDDTDKFLMGNCKTVTPFYIATKVFDLAGKNQEVKDALCKAVAACNIQAAVCPIVTNATAVYNGTTKVLSTEITNNGVGRYRVAYRLVGTKNLFGTDIITAGIGPVTPHQWTAVEGGQYEIVVVSLCNNGTESQPYYSQTIACMPPASFTVALVGSAFEVRWGATAAPNVRLTIDQPNGGQTVTTHASGVAQPLLVPVPASIYGDFRFRLQSACGAAWFSDYTAQVTLNIPLPDACPTVTKVVVSNVTANSATITATKPTGPNQPIAYTLILTDSSGATTTYTNFQVGDTVTWNVTGLKDADQYTVEIEPQCKSGRGSIFFGGKFLTPIESNLPPTASGNAEIINATGLDASSTSVFYNDAMVHYAAPHEGTGAYENTVKKFYSPTFTGAQVKVVICDVIVQRVTLTDASFRQYAVAYKPDNQTWIFNDVDTTNGIHINFE